MRPSPPGVDHLQPCDHFHRCRLPPPETKTRVTSSTGREHHISEQSLHNPSDHLHQRRPPPTRPPPPSLSSIRYHFHLSLILSDSIQCLQRRFFSPIQGVCGMARLDVDRILDGPEFMVEDGKLSIHQMMSHISCKVSKETLLSFSDSFLGELQLFYLLEFSKASAHEHILGWQRFKRKVEKEDLLKLQFFFVEGRSFIGVTCELWLASLFRRVKQRELFKITFKIVLGNPDD